jgi:hypothetical protein
MFRFTTLSLVNPMSKKPDPTRDRLMLAAMDARDLLRTFVIGQ